MAATNYTPIQLYFSTTASAVPLAANLAQGELAINITDGKLYYEDNAGVVQVIATKGAGTIGGSTTQIQYNNAGALAGNAAMTFNSGTNTTTLTTLNLTNALGATYGGTAQSAYAQGDFLYASATNTLSKLSIGTVNYILTSTGSVPQWSAPSSIIVQTATNLAGGAGGSVPYQSAVDTTTFLAIGAANRVMTSTGTAPQWVTSLTGLTGVSSSSITNTSLTSGRVVVSTTAGLQADDADLTFDGTTLSAGGYSTVGLTTLVKTVKIGDSNFSGVAVFAAATPAKLYIGTGTVTDTTSAIGATNAVGAISSLAITPIAATNTSVTYTNAATLYIAGAPSAGTNVTLTNPYALYVAAGDAYFGGTVTAGTVNLTTLDLTNLEVTNIKAKDGTAAMTIADSTGVVSFTANPILSGGTANGVLYLNGSKVATSGSALVFDGTNLSVGTTALSGGKFSTLADLTLVNGLVIRDSATTYANNDNYVLLQNSTGVTVGGFTHPAVNSLGVWGNDDIRFFQSGAATELMRLNSTGLGIGTNNPLTKLQVNSTAPTLRLEETTTGGSKRLELGVTSGGQAFIDAPQSAQSLVLRTLSTTRLTISSTGNLDVASAGNFNVEGGYVRAGGGSDAGTQLVMWTTAGGDGNIAAFQTIFNTGANSARTERMRISSTGRITINNTEYTCINGSVNGKTPAGTGFSFGYNPSGGSGESQLVWGTGGSTYPFIISSYDGSSTTERARFTTDGSLCVAATSNSGNSGTVIYGYTGSGGPYNNNSGAFWSSNGNITLTSNFASVNFAAGATKTSAAPFWLTGMAGGNDNGYYINLRSGWNGSTGGGDAPAYRIQYGGTATIATITSHTWTLGQTSTATMLLNSGGLTLSTKLNVNGGDTDPVTVTYNGQRVGLTVNQDSATYNNIFRFGNNLGKFFDYNLTANTTTPTLTIANNNGNGVALTWGSTSWSSTSDERVKDIIEPITNAVAKVRQLRAVIGKYKTDAEGMRRAFLIAQDVQNVLPEAVGESAQINLDGFKELVLRYTETIPLLVAAINELGESFESYVASHP